MPYHRFMIDLNDLRKRPDIYQSAVDHKAVKVSVKDFLVLDTKRRELITQIDAMRATKNDVSKEVPKLQGDEKQKVITQMKTLGDELKQKEPVLELVARTRWHFPAGNHFDLISGMIDHRRGSSSNPHSAANSSRRFFKAERRYCRR